MVFVYIVSEFVPLWHGAYLDGFVQERRNSIALAIFKTKISMCMLRVYVMKQLCLKLIISMSPIRFYDDTDKWTIAVLIVPYMHCVTLIKWRTWMRVHWLNKYIMNREAYMIKDLTPGSLECIN